MSKTTQQERLRAYLAGRSLVRAKELRTIGIGATAIARAVASGVLTRVGRGLYRSPDRDIAFDASLAEASKLAPKGVVCLLSALSFHGLTDQLPRAVWLAIGARDWKPRIASPPTRVVRFREPHFSGAVERHAIDGVEVPVYSVAKSLADAFRNPRLVDRSVAIECLRAALENRKASPGDLAAAGERFGAGKAMRAYLEALTSNG